MIKKIEGTRNGYLLDETSTKADWKNICNDYGKRFKCLICNKTTMKRFEPNKVVMGNHRMTVNNKLEDNVVYINGVY